MSAPTRIMDMWISNPGGHRQAMNWFDTRFDWCKSEWERAVNAVYGVESNARRPEEVKSLLDESMQVVKYQSALALFLRNSLIERANSLGSQWREAVKFADLRADATAKILEEMLELQGLFLEVYANAHLNKNGH